MKKNTPRKSPFNFKEELKATSDLAQELSKSPLLQANRSSTISKNDVDAWIKDRIWVTYGLDVAMNKKLQISVGTPGFRVLHGKEIVYEGPYLPNAVEVYNAITTAPDSDSEPKLDN